MLKVFLTIGTLVMGCMCNAADLSGDTIGAALANLSSLQKSLTLALSPQTLTGKVGRFDRAKIGKAECAELGESIGYAFAIQREIRFNTPSLNERSFAGDVIARDLFSLINYLLDARTKFCVKNIENSTDVTQDIYQSQVLAQKITESLEEDRRK